MVSIILSIFTLIYKSQVHFGLSQPWEVSVTISSILQVFLNIPLRLKDVKSVLKVIANQMARPIGNNSLILRLRG